MTVLTVTQVAKELQVGNRTVTHLLEAGKLKGKQVGFGNRKHWRVTRAQLEEYLQTPDNVPSIPTVQAVPITSRLLRLS